MLGAIAGDIIGSIYEWDNIKTKHFPLFSKKCTFTDDSVLTVAVADSILNDILQAVPPDTAPSDSRYVHKLKEYFRAYPNAGYGISFGGWADSPFNYSPYNSYGNGSAMRVSPVGFAYNDLATVLEKAKQSAEVTHNHPEGIKGAQATAAAIFLARTQKDKTVIKQYIEETFAYRLNKTLAEIRPIYEYDVSCQGTVPPAIIAFLEATDFEDAIRNAISLGGDSDTLACITGGIAQAFYGIPYAIADKVFSILDARLGTITRQFLEKYLD